jgi:hypothetical protein
MVRAHETRYIAPASCRYVAGLALSVSSLAQAPPPMRSALLWLSTRCLSFKPWFCQVRCLRCRCSLNPRHPAGLTPAAIASLASALPKLSCLHALTLPHTLLSELTSEPLVAAIGACENLRSLYVKQTMASARVALSSLARHIRGCRKLQKFALLCKPAMDCPPSSLLVGLAACTSLTSLEWGVCGRLYGVAHTCRPSSFR